MKKSSFSISTDLATEIIRAVAIVAGLTLVMLLIGRAVLGEAVIAMLYLLAVGWLTSRAGQIAGLSAAVTAALTFDFFFIPPFFTFNVESLEGWLMLIIFVLVAVVLVNRIQAGLARAQTQEREAILLHELSMALVGLQTREAVAQALAERLQQLYQAAQVQVTFLAEENRSAITATAPAPAGITAKPDQMVPILTSRRLVGEINLWSGEVAPPPTTERFLQALASQVTLALGRMQPAASEAPAL